MLHLSFVVHGPIYGRFVNFSLYKDLPRLGTPGKRLDWSTEGKRPDLRSNCSNDGDTAWDSNYSHSGWETVSCSRCFPIDVELGLPVVGETRALMGGYVAGGINWCFLVLNAVTIAVSLFLVWLFFSSFHWIFCYTSFGDCTSPQHQETTTAEPREDGEHVKLKSPAFLSKLRHSSLLS